MGPSDIEGLPVVGIEIVFENNKKKGETKTPALGAGVTKLQNERRLLAGSVL